jgi:hypothetical protein
MREIVAPSGQSCSRWVLVGLTLDEAKRLAEGADELAGELAGKLCVSWYGAKDLSARERDDSLAVLDEHFGEDARGRS